ncbi:Uu.00g015980.m01.CDS01 [Anthostomella pinea]|uniref:MMS19 nucleotide excision repair protein n=1 Tax=Anthostomella pinea TaxID=933095 RepID=A0AAI8VYL7_9PEZI|nr:Uu.00g015980.m01.CDS01 [Anthostomella pinea]
MTDSKFGELALQYVLTDENEQAREIPEKAASVIQESANTRIAIGQWVQSINRWIHTGDSNEDDGFIERAKALDFLASTLEVLLRRDFALKADQIKLLATFFGSLFSSDHRAGVTASAKALRCVTSMKAFQPSLGHDIIENVCKLGDGFNLQTPATRLELYELFLRLIKDPAVANDLEYRDGNTCGFITDLLGLCRYEKDPLNLMKWFEILRTFLQNFFPSADVTSAVFERFSNYFPITLRNATPNSGVTPGDLKAALRSCFAAHYRVAGLAIPYLMNKLDNGDAVTAAVKTDILQTLNACVSQYDHPKQSVAPYVDQVWTSLKYEVRNGEVPDTIQATLKVLGSLTKRLDAEELSTFLSESWKDLAEDLSSPEYSAQAGQLLVAVSGSTVQSFASITPRALAHVQNTIKHAESSAYKQKLLVVLNNILSLRWHLTDSLATSSASQPASSSGLLNDEIFGESLFQTTYLPLWQNLSASSTSADHVGILKETMNGFATLVGQRSSGHDSPRQLCSDSTCTQIFNLLAKPVIVEPIEGRNFLDAGLDARLHEEVYDAAAASLKKAVPAYPAAFRNLLFQFLASIKTAYGSDPAREDLAAHIQLAAKTLYEVGGADATNLLDSKLLLSNPFSVVNALLEGLLWMLSQHAPAKVWTAFIMSMRYAFDHTLPSASSQHPGSQITRDWYLNFAQQIVSQGAPQLDLDQPGDPERMAKAFEGLSISELDASRHRKAYCLWVVKQLYRRFTVAHCTEDETNGKRWVIGLSKDFQETSSDLVMQQDICLHQLVRLATSTVRVLSADEQKALQLDQDAFALFNTCDGDSTNPADGEFTGPSALSSADGFRTAPLSLGILQGLHPGAIRPEFYTTLDDLCLTLTSVPSPCSDVTRTTLDTILIVLSNKLYFRGNIDLNGKRAATKQHLENTFTGISTGCMNPIEPRPDTHTVLLIHRSIFSYLAGDVPRHQHEPAQASLLANVVKSAPDDAELGLQLSQYFEILVSPKECLAAENHAFRSKLDGTWLYSKAVQPWLAFCFSGNLGDEIPDGLERERRTINRAVATFALLKHLKYNQYSADVAEIVKIGLRSLSTFNLGAEMVSCMSVLLAVLNNDPGELQEHIAGLISGTITMYEKAKKAAEAATYRTLRPSQKRDLSTCRRNALEFLQLMTGKFAARYLLPHRQQLLRQLAWACGDPMRSIRPVAIAARKAWDDLDK